MCYGPCQRAGGVRRALSNNDRDPDSSDTLTVSAVNGAGAMSVPALWARMAASRWPWTAVTPYTPNTTTAKALGPDRPRRIPLPTISDGHGGTEPATITITLSGCQRCAGCPCRYQHADRRSGQRQRQRSHRQQDNRRWRDDSQPRQCRQRPGYRRYLCWSAALSIRRRIRGTGDTTRRQLWGA